MSDWNDWPRLIDIAHAIDFFLRLFNFVLCSGLSLLAMTKQETRNATFENYLQPSDHYPQAGV